MLTNFIHLNHGNKDRMSQNKIRRRVRHQHECSVLEHDADGTQKSLCVLSCPVRSRTVLRGHPPRTSEHRLCAHLLKKPSTEASGTPAAISTVLQERTSSTEYSPELILARLRTPPLTTSNTVESP